jgi:hypothetical protein
MVACPGLSSGLLASCSREQQAAIVVQVAGTGNAPAVVGTQYCIPVAAGARLVDDAGRQATR